MRLATSFFIFVIFFVANVDHSTGRPRNGKKMRIVCQNRIHPNATVTFEDDKNVEGMNQNSQNKVIEVLTSEDLNNSRRFRKWSNRARCQNIDILPDGTSVNNSDGKSIGDENLQAEVPIEGELRDSRNRKRKCSGRRRGSRLRYSRKCNELQVEENPIEIQNKELPNEPDEATT